MNSATRMTPATGRHASHDRRRPARIQGKRPAVRVINFAAIRTALEHDPDLVAYFDDLLAVAADHQQTLDTMRKEIGWLADSLEPHTQHDTIKRLLFIRDIGTED